MPTVAASTHQQPHQPRSLPCLLVHDVLLQPTQLQRAHSAVLLPAAVTTTLVSRALIACMVHAMRPKLVHDSTVRTRCSRAQRVSSSFFCTSSTESCVSVGGV